MPDEPDEPDALVDELARLARGVAVPDNERLTTAVMTRVAALPTPVPPRSWAQRFAALVETPRRRVALVLAAVLFAIAVTPPVRAAVLDWLGFHGVFVERGTPREGPAGPPPEVPHGGSVSEAAASVGFPVWVPTELGPPDGVEVSADARMVSMSWSGGPDGVVRLDQFDARLDFSVAKVSPTVRYASVGGSDALWFEEPHEVDLVDADGTRRSEAARLAGHTLIWPSGVTTLRLEGDLDLARAVEIAESAAQVQ